MRFLKAAVAAILLAAAVSAWPHMGGVDMDFETRANIETLQSGPRQDKLASAVAQSKKTEYSSLPSFSGDISSPLNLLKFSTISMDASFDTVSDSMPDSRNKYIHSMGSTAPVKFVPTANSKGYTGLFKGGDSCLARLSLAANPSKVSFTPGMALKCFRDGSTASGNFITMFSLDGQPDDNNFFANEFTNVVGTPTSTALKIIAKIFERASHCPTWIALRQFSAIDQTGNIEASPKWPQQIFLVPAEVSFSSTSTVDFRAQLGSIAVGRKLWDVYAIDKVGDAASTRVKVGEIVTTGSFVASSWSDKVLFFQHERGEVDNCPEA